MRKLFAFAFSLALCACGSSSSSSMGVTGTWTGYVENLQVPSGSSTIRVVLAGGANTLSGTVVFGSAPAPPAPTDGNLAYPPEYDGRHPVSIRIEGFEYRFASATQTVSRVTFDVELGQIWETWCALQTPIEDPPGSGHYACVRNCGAVIPPAGDCELTCRDAPPETLDCGKLELCLHKSVCTCTSAGCAVLPQGHGRIAFDLTFDGDGADGSMRAGWPVELARFARTHGQWPNATLDLEELHVILADTCWKGRRDAELETAIAKHLAGDGELWRAFAALDEIVERLAENAAERLEWQAAHPV